MVIYFSWLEMAVSLFGKLKTKYDFLTGKLVIVKIIEASDDDMLCSDGTRIKIQAAWKDNLALFKTNDASEINYVESNEDEDDEGILTILKNGQFVGVLVHRAMIYEAEYGGDTPQIVGLNVVNGAHFSGWFSGDINDYCRQMMSSNFAKNAEWLINKERETYSDDE